MAQMLLCAFCKTFGTSLAVAVAVAVANAKIVCEEGFCPFPNVPMNIQKELADACVMMPNPQDYIIMAVATNGSFGFKNIVPI